MCTEWLLAWIFFFLFVFSDRCSTDLVSAELDPLFFYPRPFFIAAVVNRPCFFSLLSPFYLHSSLPTVRCQFSDVFSFSFLILSYTRLFLAINQHPNFIFLLSSIFDLFLLVSIHFTFSFYKQGRQPSINLHLFFSPHLHFNIQPFPFHDVRVGWRTATYQPGRRRNESRFTDHRENGRRLLSRSRRNHRQPPSHPHWPSWATLSNRVQDHV